MWGSAIRSPPNVQTPGVSGNLIHWRRCRLRQSFLIGLAQAVALAPGISRSGTTIAAGLAQGLRREAATRYSFLLGAPAFLGAGLLHGGSMLATESGGCAG